MTKQEEKPNAFLIEQARKMAQREALQEARKAELEAKKIPVGAPEPSKPISDANHRTVESYNPGTGETFARTVTLAQPPTQRFEPQVLPSIGELHNEIQALITDLNESREAYQNLSLDDYYAPLKALEAEQARLRAELAKVEAEIADFRSHGTPKEGYTNHIINSEAQVFQIASLLFNVLVDTEARAKFNVPASRLQAATRKDLGIQFEDKLRPFMSPFYTRTGKQQKTVFSDGQLTERSEQLVADLEKIAKENL
jgi:hypothetical protein